MKLVLGMEVGLSPGDFVLDGDPAAPPPKGHSTPNFRHISVAAKWLMDQDVTWYGAMPRPRRLCVGWGPRCPLPKRGRQTPKFLAHVYCDQTVGWMKLVLGMVVGLSPGEFCTRWGPSPLPQKGQSPLPNFKG